LCIEPVVPCSLKDSLIFVEIVAKGVSQDGHRNSASEQPCWRAKELHTSIIDQVPQIIEISGQLVGNHQRISNGAHSLKSSKGGIRAMTKPCSKIHLLDPAKEVRDDNSPNLQNAHVETRRCSSCSALSQVSLVCWAGAIIPNSTHRDDHFARETAIQSIRATYDELS